MAHTYRTYCKHSIKILGIMRKLKYALSRNALNQMYLYHLLPIIEYASLVWDGCTQQDSNTYMYMYWYARGVITHFSYAPLICNHAPRGRGILRVFTLHCAKPWYMLSTVRTFFMSNPWWIISVLFFSYQDVPRSGRIHSTVGSLLR